MRETQFENYKRLFELQEEFVSRLVADHSTNLRYPESMDRLLNEEIDNIKRKVGVRFSKNDLIVLCVMICLNYGQNPEDSKRIFRQPNKANLNNYIDETQDKLVERVKALMFLEEQEILLNPKLTYKTRTQKVRRLRERLPEELRW